MTDYSQDIEQRETDLLRAVLLLDASLPALDRAAAAERRREAGKSMRQVTERERAKAAHNLVARLCEKYGFELD